MSKELEYIQRHIDIVKQQIKGSKMKIIVTDAVTKHQYDYYENELQTLESIEKSLNRLESIDNAEPSEALECLEYIENKLRGLRVECERIKNHRCDDVFIQEHTFDTIKQALLKAQEPKQYVDELKLVEKKLKALEIIKEKYPDVVEVKLCNNYEHYKLRMSSKHDTEIVKIDWNDKSLVDYLKLLTEEEFNLLKGILNDEQ